MQHPDGAERDLWSFCPRGDWQSRDSKLSDLASAGIFLLSAEGIKCAGALSDRLLSARWLLLLGGLSGAVQTGRPWSLRKRRGLQT